jgi:hypothetical protein
MMTGSLLDSISFNTIARRPLNPHDMSPEVTRGSVPAGETRVCLPMRYDGGGSMAVLYK